MTARKGIPYNTQQACPANVVAFTDYPMTANEQIVRKTHIDELRTAVGGEETRRDILSAPNTYADTPIVANETLIRKIHVDELRQYIEKIRDPEGYPAHSCPTNQDGCVCETHVITLDVDHNEANYGTSYINTIFRPSRRERD